MLKYGTARERCCISVSAEISAMPPPDKQLPLLVKGMRGEAVRDAQRKLNARLNLETKLVEDGIFGDNTDTAVRDFQRRNGLTIDGKIGPQQTWPALNAQIAVVMIKVESDRPPPAPQPPPGGLSEAWKRRFIERNVQGQYLKLDLDFPAQSIVSGGDRIYQVQGQFGRTFSPWIDWNRPTGAPAPSSFYAWAAVIAMTWRSSQDDRHWEQGPLVQFNGTLDSTQTVQVAYQVLYADLIHFHRYHLASFYFQPSLTPPLLDSPDWIVSGALGYQAQVELGGENCTLFVQGQVAGAVDLHTREFTFGAGVILGATVNIPSDPKRMHWNVCKPW
jgi:hypothetical protein